ncbi:MAG: hypothetical protein ABI528_04765, partial [bacterium]
MKTSVKILILTSVVIFFSIEYFTDLKSLIPSRSEKMEEERSEIKFPSDQEYFKRTFPFGTADADAHLVAMERGNQMRQESVTDNSTAAWEFAGPYNIGGRAS